ncbi:hypothetical protein GCM10009759_14250 [Kitasatospora saccharophila]|uniref:Small integral membrane protein DUF2273 n=1 Tax=Kitasatospora saccharophila TaxID=407973 RepID=A0ABN2WEE9_9ACTN
MSTAAIGLFAGMALGFAGYFGGFWAFLLVLVLGAAGLVVGRFLEDGPDVREWRGPRSGDRRR